MKDKTKVNSKKESVLKSWKVSVRKKKCQKDSADVALLHYTTTDYFCENDSFLLMLTLRKYKHRKKGSCSWK